MRYMYVTVLLFTRSQHCTGNTYCYVNDRYNVAYTDIIVLNLRDVINGNYSVKHLIF